MPSYHSARILSLIALLTMPLFAQATTVMPIAHQGTWENKDEDGDGVPDELDDYPFDKDKSSYEVVVEEEFNNNLAVANQVHGGVPFRVSGTIQESQDLDLFKFQVTERKEITVLLKSDNIEFLPYVTIFKSNGESLQIVTPHYTPVGKIRSAVSFTLPKSGNYYLVIGDKEARGNPDFNYEAFLFEDIDVDAIDDRIESAFGLSNQVQDTDGDQVFDGDEFYVYEYGDTLAHDIDKDGVPNWLDEDSDNDGIPDRIEKAKDLEQDGLAAFVDLDSDGNNIEDKIEVGDNNLNPTDSDLDGDADYIDIDDDNDGLLDVNDNEPREKVLSLMPNSEGYKDITSVSYLYNGEEIDDINLALEPHLLKGYGLSPDGYLVFIGNKNQSPINTRVTTDKNENIIFTMPKGMQSMFYYANGSRTNIVKINYSNNNNIPIINKLSKDYYQEGETVYITGRYFNEDTRVMVEGNEIIPVISSPTNLSLILPQTTSPTIRVSLKTSYGESNKKELKIGNNISLQLHLPQNTQVDYSKLRIESLRSPTGTAYTFAADLHSDMVVGGGHDVIIISYQDDSGSYWPYLYQVTFGNSTQFEASPLNSSKSVSWYLAGIKNLVPSSEWGDFFDKLSNLKEIEDLANFIALNASDLEYAKNNSSSYQPLEDKAVNAARSLAQSLHQESIKSTSFHPPKTAQLTAQLPKGEYKPNIQSD